MSSYRGPYMINPTPARQTGRAEVVEAVGPEAVHDHPPGQRARDEHAPVRGEDAAEVGVGLQGRDEAVRTEGDHTGADPQQPALLAHALPHQPRPADLGERGEQEQRDRAQHEHG